MFVWTPTSNHYGHMKKTIVVIVLLLLSISLLAQLEVKEGSFKEVPGFVNINTEKMYDDNDKPYAVLKIKTENIGSKERRELKFGGDAQTFFEVEYKDGEVWLYISYYASFIKISHEEYSSTEFYFPFDMKPKCGYEMTLVNKIVPVVPVKDIYNYLIVKTDQTNAAIYIDDEFVGEQEIFKPYLAGTKHAWRIECELYHSENDEIMIPDKDGENATVDIVLRPAFGYLNVNSSPDNGAIVYIDGKKVGQTPYQSERLASGEHMVRIVKEMFSPVEKVFTITDGNTTLAQMDMIANFVNVTVSTDLESDIYIDNEKKNKGSWIGRLNEGPHSIEARKASHVPSTKNVQFVIGRDTTIVIPDPVPIYGTIDIASNPIGANIIIDGQSFGTTPRVLNNVLVGNHKLSLEKSGYVIIAKDITLDDSIKLTVNETLVAGKTVSISTDGDGDKVFIDGNYIGVSPLEVTLGYGRYIIKAIRGGIVSEKSITVSKVDEAISVVLKYYPDGAVNGVFSVSKNKKVYFSKGNLQYQASTNTWRFAENQWDYVGSSDVQRGQPGGNVPGSSNDQISSSYSGWIDLFGWGTSGYPHGATCYQPWHTSTHSYDYYVYGNQNRNIFDRTGKADWGYNTISNGGNVENVWRTLTIDEWAYLINTRNTLSGIKFAKAQVNGVNGIILLPDDWKSTIYTLNSTNTSDVDYNTNIINQSNWINILEPNGVVFLPAAGYRFSNWEINYLMECGYYWSTNRKSEYYAYRLVFQNDSLNPSAHGERRDAISVRLVQDAE